MGLRDCFKRRKSKAARNVPSNETDTADSNGCQSRQPQAGSSGLTDPPDGMNGLNKSPENFKGRLIQDTPIRELWNVAYEKLREEDGKLIEDYEAKLIGSVTTGLGETLNLKQDRREWMQAILSNKMEEVNNELEPGSFKAQAKDTMQLVLNIVNSAKDYIGSAANANPYTSIAWTGVSFLLPLLINISEEETSLTKGLEYITSLIVQSRMREELYVNCYESGAHNHERFRQSHTQYKTALERLYTYILRFQATACCHYSKSSALRHGLDAVKWKDWAQLADEVREQERNFAAIEQMWRDFQRYEKHLTSINTFSEMNAKLSALADHEFADLLKWLCDVDPSSIYNTGLDRHEAGTCEWLMDSEEFKTWKTSDGSLLWLHGKAGSGKSILSSSVIKYLRDQHASEPLTVVSYFYFSFSDPEKQKVDVMLASLTKQICSRQTKRSQLMERLGQYKISGQRPDTETLEAILIATASEFSNLYIVIDALDECPLLNDQRGKLLKSLRRILATAPNEFHFFLTSRKEPDIDDKIRPILSSTDKNEIDLLARQQIINKDICHYIDSQLSGDEYKNWPKSLKDEARESLVKKADCMFQYVHFQLEALRNLEFEPEVRKALRELPTGLDATYNRALESIPPNFKERVIHSLKWLAFSRAVLYVEELAEIFTIRPHNNISFNEKERPFSPTAILKYFSGLIIAQERYSPGRSQSDTHIRLVHFSLKEYLISERIKQGPGRAFSFIEDDAQFSVVRSCLAYLNHLNHWVVCQTTEYPLRGTVIESYPLAAYATRYWMAHLEEIPRGSWSSDIERDAASALAVGSQSLCALLLLLNTGRHRNKRQYILKPYCYTAERGHLQLTKMLIYEKPGAYKYITREELDEALQQMAYEGRTDAMQLFIEAGADVNAHCGKSGSALQAAAEGGHLDCLKLLVRSGAKVNSPSNNDRCLLTCTAEMNTESLQFLLDSGADINMQDKLYTTALHKAIMDYHDTNFDLLLERGANVNTLTNLGTPLQVACKSQSRLFFDRTPRKIARYTKKLLESGADPNLRGGESGTALQLACDNKDLFPNRHVAMEVVQLLVENGTVGRGTIIQGFVVEEADEHSLAGKASDLVWETKWETGSPVVESAVEVMKLLLENGARIEEPLALHVACIWRDKERVRGLLDQGADVNAKSDSYGTPLHAILTYHVDNNCITRRFRKPSRKKSLCEETVPIVQLLLSKGAQVNYAGGKYGTALQAACCNRALSVDTTRCLLEHGADVNAGGGKYGTALVAACTSDREVDFVRLLIEHGADVNAEGGEYGTALAAACRRGAPELVRLLLEHGANIHHRDYAAWNAAARRSLFSDGDIEILDLLFDQVSDKSHAGDELGTALNSLLENYFTLDEDQTWHKRFRWLLEHGADVNVKSGKYGFALQAACAGEAEFDLANNINTKYGTAKLLLEQYPEINVNAQGGIFGSALQAAAFYGQTVLVRLLLDREADVNARGGKYGSALNAAIFGGYWDIVEILLQKGAIPDYRLRQQPDEEWLQRVSEEWSEELEKGWRKRNREADRLCTIARYRKFWEVESGSAVGTE